MHVRRLPVRLAVALAALSLLAACGGSPAKPTAGTTKDDKSTLAEVGPGTVLPEALVETHCVREDDGSWRASGVVKNTEAKKLSFDVRIHIGPSAGKSGTAQVVHVAGLKPGKTAPWGVQKVITDDPAGPCQLQVVVAK